MKFSALVYLCLILAVTGCSCGQERLKPALGFTEKNLELLNGISEELKKNPDLEYRLSFWKQQLQKPEFNKDAVLLSKIHYNIAGVFYAKKNLDSIKYHMQLAWQLMENRTGFDKDKLLLYSGLGNAAHMEQKLHQENYYYNRAAQMLASDSNLQLSPKQKVMIYLAAGQSSKVLRQFDNAFNMNRKAIAILPELPDDPKSQFRAYNQMASCYALSRRNQDSLRYYIVKLEEINRRNPDWERSKFIFGQKSDYFEWKGERDSAIFYEKKALHAEIADEKENGAGANSIVTGNLFATYVDMASFFLDEGKLDSGLYYLQQSEKLARQYPGKQNDDQRVWYLKNKVIYLFATKQYAAAEQENQRLLDGIKQLYEGENARAIAEMSTIFQLQAKDKSIHLLNETVSLTETRLQQNRLWLAVSALAALLAVAIALLLYFIQRQRKLKNESEKMQLEQRLLRTQMEPHFIFNTLAVLQGFIRLEEKEKALKYLHRFSRLLRGSLELSRESKIPLTEEISILDNYLGLQQMRYEDAFEYHIEYDEEEELEMIVIPPMLIQPFVENAILYGINPNEKNGQITIDFEVRDKKLLVTIRDNGKGISNHRNPDSHKSLSTAISRERLGILAKESGFAAGIAIESSPEKGTSVLITLPIR